MLAYGVRRLFRDRWTAAIAIIAVLVMGLAVAGVVARMAFAVAAVLLPLAVAAVFGWRRHGYASDYVAEAAAALARNRQRRLGGIRAALYDLANESDRKSPVGDLGAEALDRFTLSQTLFERFSDLLGRKLVPGELAHTRYRETAERYMLGMSDQLGRAADALQATDDSADATALSGVRAHLSELAEAQAALERAARKLEALPDIDAGVRADVSELTRQLDQIGEQMGRLQADET